MKKIKQKILLLLAFLSFAPLTGSAQEIRVATYNIRLQTAQDSGNLWQDRKEALCQVIRYHEFDIFGVQEAFDTQLQDMLTLLPTYRHIGVGRDDGQKKGEHSAIFYDPSRFELVREGTFWLSDKDTERPNKGWDAALPRICTWGIFKDQQNKKSFIFMNTHFDHKGKVAQLESTKLILTKAHELAEGLPIILTGDFNVDEKSSAYQTLAQSTLVKDTHDLAGIVYEPNSTFNGWGKSLKPKSRIDHIFVSPTFKIKKYGVLTDTYLGKYPSDHFPVTSLIQW
ncbi:endonuclease/exonuclease/phosphatase family protein [Parapedobacter sp. SGR-10]|uniref:endonuclease/exonuclease/phosphatase family protein n=1 Tax=Parapedobacter sp. SGR-10 TaxID=2710879 RepID=UPI0013D09541|nr:endonuclease/exonuclease/phosphatase family protein [Parapedobacter sp. SGR-10]NGF55633.1 endonuclease/exonuclease/phosphatase family protein [Parapedobacter sp. SGR-10]